MVDEHKCGGCCPGPQGNMGPQGLQGVQGVPGKDGAQGQAGQMGLQGVPGEKGEKGDKGDQGVPGQQGALGAQGPQGVPGQQGQPGLNGQVGPQGVPGAQGLPGQQGLQGIPGDCVECPCHCDAPEFAEVFSSLPQTLAASPGALLAGQVVLLENTLFASPSIDVSQAGVNGKIIINKAGWYDVYTGICGYLNPIASPLPCWTLSLFKNGVYVAGSTFANQTISPEQKSNEIVADVFVHFNVGDVLELCNTSTAIVNMAAPTLGTNSPANSAYMKLILLQAD